MPVSPPPPIPPENTTTTLPATPTQTSASPPSPMPIGAPDLATIAGYAVAGILTVFAIVFIMLLFMRRESGTIGGGGRLGEAKTLLRCIADMSVDAIGLVIDLDTSEIHVVPLMQLESFFLSKDPNKPYVIMANPSARTFMMHGKPVIISPAVGKIGYQLDIENMTRLGMAKLAVEDELWKDTTEPQKSYELLIRKIGSIIQARTGKLQISPDTKISFQMSPPEILIALIKEDLSRVNAILTNLVNFSGAVNAIAKAIREHRTQEIRAKGTFWYMILIGGAMLALFVSLGLWILSGGLG